MRTLGPLQRDVGQPSLDIRPLAGANAQADSRTEAPNGGGTPWLTDGRRRLHPFSRACDR